MRVIFKFINFFKKSDRIRGCKIIGTDNERNIYVEKSTDDVVGLMDWLETIMNENLTTIVREYFGLDRKSEYECIILAGNEIIYLAKEEEKHIMDKNFINFIGECANIKEIFTSVKNF